MPALKRNEKEKRGDCGIMYNCQKPARHRKRCQKQKEYKCIICHFYTKSKEEMNYHTVKKHAQPSSKQSTVCFSYEQDFPNYFSLQHPRRKEHGAKQRKLSDTVADLNKDVEEKGEVGEKLKKEHSACQRFLVGTEIKMVFNFPTSKLEIK